jgi:hypothetical protein
MPLKKPWIPAFGVSSVERFRPEHHAVQGFRRNGRKTYFQTFYETIKFNV